eukprot:5626491-Prymnesium_polylepis.2
MGAPDRRESRASPRRCGAAGQHHILWPPPVVEASAAVRDCDSRSGANHVYTRLPVQLATCV